MAIEIPGRDDPQEDRFWGGGTVDSLTLSGSVFKAKVTPGTNFSVGTVTLKDPGGNQYPMTYVSISGNQQTWQYMLPVPPPPIAKGTWTATASFNATDTSSYSTTV